MKKKETTRIALFQGKEVRKTIHRNEWWFSVIDVIEILTESADPKQYVKKLRKRDEELSSNWGTICTPIKLLGKDKKTRKIMCSNTEGIFRIIQSIPSQPQTQEHPLAATSLQLLT